MSDPENPDEAPSFSELRRYDSMTPAEQRAALKAAMPPRRPKVKKPPQPLTAGQLIWIIIGTAIVGLVGWFGVHTYNERQADKREDERTMCRVAALLNGLDPEIHCD